MSRPTAAEAPALPVVAWLHRLLTESYRETSITSFSAEDPWQEALKEVGHAVTSSALVLQDDAQAALDKLTAERDAAFALSRCECAPDEGCANLARLTAERDEARAERDGLRAARIAYASEFSPDAEGEPDVGNIHANIRALKAQPAINVDEAMRLADEYAHASRWNFVYGEKPVVAAREALRAYLGGKP